ncbi:MAG: hypothetical protein AB7K24_01745 [Gemmataceae bacterium]
MLMAIMVSGILLVAAPVPDELAHTQEIRKLLPQAASLPLEDWQRLAKPGATPKNPESLPVTALFLVENSIFKDIKSIGKQDETVENTRQALHAHIEKSAKMGYVSVIQPEGITEFTCRFESPTSAQGTVTFRVADRWELKLAYRALRLENTWRIQEFRFPLSQLRVQQKDGKWITEPLEKN